MPKKSKAVRHINSIWDFIANRPKTAIAIIITIAICLVLLFGISYDPRHGLRWRPAADINVNFDKEFKK